MPSIETIKMEDRKRPALDPPDGHTPMLKRQAVSVNGVNAHPDTDMPWKDDINAYQKDAIMRQMKEYKRELQTLQSQLEEAAARASHHDHHIRTTDAWFSQLIDEIRLLSTDSNPTTATNVSNTSHFDSSLLSSTDEIFSAHLTQRSDLIKTTIAQIFSRFPITAPDVATLQDQLAKLLAAEKAHVAELQRLNVEKDDLMKRLEDASMRYMLAEKKLDRMKSAQVAKLEAQAINTPKPEANDKSSNREISDGPKPEDAAEKAATETARKEAVALAQKRTDQLEKVVHENVKLTEDLNTARIKASAIIEDDFANTDLFKALKTQHEDVIKRLNDLVATNEQLRNEARQLQAERTAYRAEVDNELQSVTIDLESNLARTDADLSRVRHARDDLIAKLSVKDASIDQHSHAFEQIKQLAESRESRIAALESELERLRPAEPQTDIPVVQLNEDAQIKITTIEKEKSMLESELRSMEQAWRKASTAAGKKTAEILELEEKSSRLATEKAKADQKYFATEKSKASKENELRSLKAQNGKATEIVSQLKEAEAESRSLAVTLEKQLAEARETLASLILKQRSSQQGISEHKIMSERLTAQVTELKNMLSEKDNVVRVTQKTQRDSDAKAAELQVRIEETEKMSEKWRKKCKGNQSEEIEMLQNIALCNVCKKNFRNTALKSCGHTFCNECVDQRWKDRSRKCPNCGKSFAQHDPLRITL